MFVKPMPGSGVIRIGLLRFPAGFVVEGIGRHQCFVVLFFLT